MIIRLNKVQGKLFFVATEGCFVSTNMLNWIRTWNQMMLLPLPLDSALACLVHGVLWQWVGSLWSVSNLHFLRSTLSLSSLLITNTPYLLSLVFSLISLFISPSPSPLPLPLPFSLSPYFPFFIYIDNNNNNNK
jgi:hypothetical protein